MATHSFSILIVDDIIDNLDFLQLFLESEGYRVDVASGGSMALSKIQRAPPDLLLLDVMMPDMNGLEVAQHLRRDQKFASLPILLITANGEINLEQAKTVGANDLLCKPVDFDELLIKVRLWCPSTKDY